MSSTTPSRSNRYHVDSTTKLTEALWNAAIGDAFAAVDALEALRGDVEQAIRDAASGNLDAVLQGQLASRLTATQTAFDALKAALDLAQDQLVAIQTGIVIAQSVRVAPGAATDIDRSVQEVLDLIALRLAALQTDAQLLGNPRVPTAPVGDRDTTIANTEFVARAIAAQGRASAAYALTFGRR